MIDRFTDAIYSPAEVARFLALPASTLRSWTDTSGDVGSVPLVTAQAATARGAARVPFVGLAEAYTLRAIRAAGVPMQRIRPALEQLARDGQLKHVLASERLFTDGADLLMDVAEEASGEGAAAMRQLVVVRSGQRVLHQVVRDYLHRITFEGGYAQVIPLPTFDGAVVVDPTRGFGHPIFASSGTRLDDALDLFKAGVYVRDVADEFAISAEELQQALRAQMKLAA